MSFLERVHRAMYGKSADIAAPENCDNAHFLAGRLVGLHWNSDCGLDAIADQWHAIGSPAELPESFKEWKRGFHAGRLESAHDVATALTLIEG
jgi:hypothetical protein